jgi:hypothetical protein
VRARAAAAALAAALACAASEDEEPLPRVVGAAPVGDAVPTTAEAAIWFSTPVDPAGLLDGRLLAIVPASALRDALLALEGDAGTPPGEVPASAALEDGGRRVALRPAASLRGFTRYALVLSSRARAADGRPMLDPEGRRRTYVAPFGTGAPEGPPPRPVLTEVRADAGTPEAGGEYVEIANLGAGSLDLGGWRLGKRTAAGALAWCTVAAPEAAAVPGGGVALVGGGAWDGRYALPPGVPVLSCGGSALLGGLANDRAPAILLADPVGNVRTTLGEGGAPRCTVALERIDPAGPDAPWNLACAEGSPGRL